MIKEEDVNVDEYVSLVATNEQNNAQANYTFPKTVGVGTKAIVRFINGVAASPADPGTPGSGRAKLFNVSWIKDDKGKFFRLCLPAVINNKPMYPHTLLDFIDKVLSRTWVEDLIQEDGKKGGWKYFYAERNDYGQLSSGTRTLKDIFLNVYKSGASPSNQYYKSQKSWRGQTIYVANVIDRLDYKWHQENKKTKLLMRKVDVKDNQVRNKELSFYAVGSGLEDLIGAHGAKLNYDVLIYPGAEAKDKFHFKNLSKLKLVNYWDEVSKVVTEDDKKLVSVDPDFTDEEKTWDPIDIDKYYKFTSASAIIDHLGQTIEAFDMMVGTNFMEQFKREAALEKKVKGATEQTESTPVAAPTQSTAETVTQAPVQSTVAPSFESMNSVTSQSTAEPEPMAVSAEAQADIDQFYAELN